MKKLIIFLSLLLAWEYSEANCPVISGSNKTLPCSPENGRRVTLSATTFTGGAGTTHEWYDSSGNLVYEDTGGSSEHSFTSYYEVNFGSSTSDKAYKVVAVKSGCSSPREINIKAIYRNNQEPTASVSFSDGDNSKCAGATFLFSASGGSSGSTYQWYTSPTGGSPVHTGSSYSVALSATTTYYLGGTIRNSGGCNYAISPRKALKANVTPNSTFSLSMDNSVTCHGNTTSVTVNGAPSGSSYAWKIDNVSNSTTGKTLEISNVTSTRSVSVTATAPGCYAPRTKSASATVSHFPVPYDLTIGNVLECNNSTGTVSIGGTSSTFKYFLKKGSWTSTHKDGRSSEAITFSGLSPGTYKVRAYHPSCGGQKRDVGSFSVSIHGKPNVSASFADSDNTKCAGATFHLQASGGSSGSTYIWYNSTSGSSEAGRGSSLNLQLSSTKTFYLGGTVKNAAGCSYPISPRIPLKANVTPNSSFSLSMSDITVCEGSSPILSVSGAPSGSVFSWKVDGQPVAETSGSLPVNDVSASTSISVTATAPGCYSPNTASASASINLFPKPGPINLQDLSICNGSTRSVTISGAFSTYNYFLKSGSSTWHPHPDDIEIDKVTFHNIPEGAYSLRGFHPSCGAQKVTVGSFTVTAHDRPTITASFADGVDTKCDGSTFFLQASGGGEGSTYVWYGSQEGNDVVDPGSSIQVQPSVPTTYYLGGTMRYGENCEFEITQRIPITADVTPKTPLTPTMESAWVCEGNSPIVTVIGAPADATFSWQVDNTPVEGSGNSLSVSNVTSPRSVSATVTVAGCYEPNTVTVTASVGILPKPSPIVLYDQSICGGSSRSLTIEGTAPEFLYFLKKGSQLWEPQPGNFSGITFDNLTEGNYSLRGYHPLCGAQKVTVGSFTVTAHDRPTITASFADGVDTKCDGSTFFLQASGGGAGSNYVWYRSQDGDDVVDTGSSIEVEPSDPTTYYLGGTISYGENCSFVVTNREAITANVNEKATLSPTLDSPDMVCENNSPIMTVFDVPPDATFAWEVNNSPVSETGASLQLNNITSPTDVSVTVTAPGCFVENTKTVSSTIGVFGKPQPLDLQDVLICDGNSTSITISGAFSTYSFFLKRGSTLLYPNPEDIQSDKVTFHNITDGAYSLRGFHPSCGAQKVTVGSFTVTAVDRPTITPSFADGMDTKCEGATFLLQATGGGEGSTYVWYDADGQEVTTQVQPTAPTTFYYLGGTVQYGEGCSFEINPRIPIAAHVTPNASYTPTLNTPVVCEGSAAVLVVSDVPEDSEYEWEVGGVPVVGGGGSLQVDNVLEPTSVSVTVTAAGCYAPRVEGASTTIGLHEKPKSPGQIDDVLVCEGSQGTVTIATSNAFLSYYLKNEGFTSEIKAGGAQIEFDFLQAGTYDLWAFNTECLEQEAIVGSVTVTVEDEPAPLTIQVIGDADGEICQSSSTFLQVQSGHEDYEWIRNGSVVATGTNVYYPRDDDWFGIGFYTVNYTASVGGCTYEMTSESIQLDIREPTTPELTLTAPDQGCVDDEIVLSAAVTTDMTVASYTWEVLGSSVTTSEDTYTLTVPEALAGQDLSVTVSATGTGCLTQGTVTVTKDIAIYALPSSMGALGDVMVCDDADASVTITGTSSGFNYFLKRQGSSWFSPSFPGGQDITFEGLELGGYNIRGFHPSCSKEKRTLGSVNLVPVLQGTDQVEVIDVCSAPLPASYTFTDGREGLSYFLTREHGGYTSSIMTIESSSSANLTFEVPQPGRYFVKASNPNCPDNDPVTVLTLEASLGVEPDLEQITYDTPAADVCQGEPMTLTVSSNKSNYQWYEDGQPVPGATSHQFVTDAQKTGVREYYVTYNDQVGTCVFDSRPTQTLYATRFELPAVSIEHYEEVARDDRSVTIQITDQPGGANYYWQVDPQMEETDAITPEASGTYVFTEENVLYLRALSTEGCWSEVSLMVPLVPTGLNSVETMIARTPIQDDLRPVVDKDLVQRSINYLDGLGRPVQSITRWGTATGKDLGVQTKYDRFGRQTQEFLPFPGTTTSGAFHQDADAQQQNYYTSRFGASDGAQAFAAKRFDDSPLNRVVEQASPGHTWRLGGGHTVQMQYLANSSERPVQSFSISSSDVLHASAYIDGELAVNVILDENEGDQRGEKMEYVDKEGQVVLKSVKLEAGKHAKTYYLYDDLGHLRYVLQPEGTRLIEEDPDFSWASVSDTDFQRKWMFVYQYDHRGRMTSKQVPGADPVYMVYDHRDRLVLTQDGNQRLINQWHFTKYDEFNRPIVTGLTSIVGSRDQVQQSVNAFYAGGGQAHEEFNSAPLFGYTNGSFPLVDINELLTVTYYDNYDFEAVALPTKAIADVQGQVTGNRTRVLGTDHWLTTMIFYDDRYRVVETISDNYVTGQDIVRTDYRNAISPLVKQSERAHTGHHSTTIFDQFAYDHMDRLLTQEQSIGGQNSVVIVANSYNEIGELETKDVGNDLQSIDYHYNIRGWLKTINGGADQLDDVTDKFGLELEYDDAGSTYHAFNGNIGRMRWKTIGGVDEGSKRYDYKYDAASRLKNAYYFVSGNSSQNNMYQVAGRVVNGQDQGIAYDANGNIEALRRRGPDPITGNRIYLDDLRYGYSGNQLDHVNDVRGDGLFSEVHSEGAVDGEYQYDPNGNMTVDANKGLQVTYNHLNLPKMVTFTQEPGKSVRYTYDAAGVKLNKESVSDATTTTTDYVGGIHYLDGDLDFLQHPEGRAIYDGQNYVYEFNLTDHLGNVRVVVGEPEVIAMLATMETENATYDEQVFSNIVETRAPDGAANHTPGGDEVARVNNERPVGPFVALSVAPGDQVDLSVFAYYDVGTLAGDPLPVESLVSALAGSVNPASVGVEGGNAALVSRLDAAVGSAAIVGDEQAQLPRGYLNYMLFDDDLNLLHGGFVQITAAAVGAREELAISGIEVTEVGYLMAYVSNESDIASFVSFDDFEIIHTTSGVKQTQDYYPFGLTFNEWTRAPENLYKYNGFEQQKETGWYQPEEFRMYDPALSRFLMIDPVIKHHESPYAWNTNNPLLYPDPSGADSTQRADALAKAEDFVDQNPGSSYELGAKGAPGENVDCSGLTSACAVAGGEDDPISTGTGGGVKRTSENLESVTESDVVPGNFVVLDNSSSGKDNPTGHIGIITEVVRDDDGNITDLKMIDSGGTQGPRRTTLISGGSKKYYGKRITGFRKFDTIPDGPIQGPTLSPVSISAPAIPGNGRRTINDI